MFSKNLHDSRIVLSLCLKSSIALLFCNKKTSGQQWFCTGEYLQGHPTAESFLNTLKVSKMDFSMLEKPVWLIWSCPKKYLSVRIFKKNFGLFESSRGLFFSHPQVLAILMGLVESSRTRSSDHLIRKF